MSNDLINIQQRLDELEKMVKRNNSNLELLNSVYSNLNKFMAFLHNDIRELKVGFDKYMQDLLDTQRTQLKLLQEMLRVTTNDTGGKNDN